MEDSPSFLPAASSSSSFSLLPEEDTARAIRHFVLTSKTQHDTLVASAVGVLNNAYRNRGAGLEIFRAPLDLRAVPRSSLSRVEMGSHSFHRKMLLLFDLHRSRVTDPTGLLQDDIFRCLQAVWTSLKCLAVHFVALFNSELATRFILGKARAGAFLEHLETVFWEFQFLCLFCVKLAAPHLIPKHLFILSRDPGDNPELTERILHTLWPLTTNTLPWRQLHGLGVLLFPLAFMRAFEQASPPPRVIENLLSRARLSTEFSGPMFCGPSDVQLRAVQSLVDPANRIESLLERGHFHDSLDSFMEKIDSPRRKKDALEPLAGQIKAVYTWLSTEEKEEKLESKSRSKKFHAEASHAPFDCLEVVHRMANFAGWSLLDTCKVFAAVPAPTTSLPVEEVAAEVKRSIGFSTTAPNQVRRNEGTAKKKVAAMSSVEKDAESVYCRCLVYEAVCRWVYRFTALSGNNPPLVHQELDPREVAFPFNRESAVEQTAAFVDVYLPSRASLRLFRVGDKEVLVASAPPGAKRKDGAITDAALWSADSKTGVNLYVIDFPTEFKFPAQMSSGLLGVAKHIKVPADTPRTTADELKIDWRDITEKLEQNYRCRELFVELNKQRPERISETATTAYAVHELSSHLAKADIALLKTVFALSVAHHGGDKNTPRDRFSMYIHPWRKASLLDVFGAARQFKFPETATGAWALPLARAIFVDKEILARMGFPSLVHFQEADKKERQRKVEDYSRNEVLSEKGGSKKADKEKRLFLPQILDAFVSAFTKEQDKAADGKEEEEEEFDVDQIQWEDDVKQS